MITCSQSNLIESLANEVHVWWQSDSDEMPTDCEAWLCSEERLRWQRYRRPADRARYLRGKVLQRSVLSRYLPIPPQDWRFQCESQGRPEIASPAEGLRLRFSLSHTTGLTALAVTLDCAVGVDVEFVGREVPDSLARFALAPAELAERAKLRTARLHDPFFEFWTLKEAYLKARGTGLSIAPATLTFSLLKPGRPHLMSTAEAWHFAQLKPSPLHELALAVRLERSVALASRTLLTQVMGNQHTAGFAELACP